MKRFLLIHFFCCCCITSFSQYSFSCLIRDGNSSESLENVSILLKGSGKGSTSDARGKAVVKNIPAGRQVLIFSNTGYKEQFLEVTFPIKPVDSVFIITLETDNKELEQVIISSSRTDSRIENTPTRVEVLGAEEVEEESGVKPSHVASLLGDIAGIQSQQTSAVTGNTDLRIQGLPGDYTQLLRNGMPLFGGYAGSFSILQVPPLDLKQIEIIKGASSTLYGGGAIAGMINIISKKPKMGIRERYLLLNQSTLKESNVNLYLSERDKKMGYTFFGGGTYQHEVDVNDDGFSDVASTENLFFHPSFFFYPNENNTISIGVNSVFEDRRGGDMQVLNRRPNGTHQFYIENQSLRNTLDITWEKKSGKTDKFSLKGTGSSFNRNITTNVFGMRARQFSYYTEASYVKKKGKHDVVGGINLNGEFFKKTLPDSSSILNYTYFTAGLFIQDDWRIHPKFTVESGLRSDFHNTYGTFILPRISLLYKINHYVTTRLGGGLGYKIPTVFSSELDERSYAYLFLDKDAKAERSTGANWDINFKKEIGDVELSINQSFYFTQINHPLVATKSPGSIIYFTETKPITTKGIETWLMVSYAGLEAYLGYTLTDTRKKYDPVHPYLDLSARDKFASVISYEFSKNVRACIEAAYTGKQYLENGSQSLSYPFVAGMIRYDVGRCSFVLNCENFFDYRQTKKESILILPRTNPTFKQLWAPIDGRVVNLSLKVRL
ncbi:MAG: TonB-dependent receptor [Chitinophagaceae bacterium]|nr:TonB-dependent receptor [Chitinophagaceae bacterium]MBL0271584.1 TonB-dependent receptor [Chitinophagaceae bacterium]